jgi:putative transposase
MAATQDISMPEGLKRLHHSGQAHFLTFSCYHRLPLFAQMHMEDRFLQALEQTRRRFEMCVFGYVLMPEHIHLLVSEPAAGSLPSFMQILKRKVSTQARRQVASTAEMPHFWQERYFDHNVRNHEGFVTQLRYIHRNPVKRGLCAKPQDWKWSSFGAWAVGEDGVVEVESEIRGARREAVRTGVRIIEKDTGGDSGDRRSWFPAFAPEKRRENGARGVWGS